MTLCVSITVLLEAYLQGRFLEVEFLGRKVSAYAVLLSVASFPSRRLIPTCIPTRNVQGAYFPTISTTEYVVIF